MIENAKKEMCCGCTACVNTCPKGCITMKEDEEGFFYPTINKQGCVNCGLCMTVCPVLNKKECKDEQTVAYAVYAKEDSIRAHSSSGGLFSLIANKVLSEGGYVFGCAFDSKFKAEHILVHEPSGLAALRGSKYVQSDLKDSYKSAKHLLEEGKQVLFSGTSCQIEGLKRFLGKSYESLIVIDVVCHGVPSPKVWKEYKAYQEAEYASSISEFLFRDKTSGWKDYRIKISFANGQIYLSRCWDDVYMKSFIKDLISRPACYSCKFRTWNRESDITLGDFWGVEKILPEWNDDKGVSLVMVHSEKGKKLLHDLLGKIKIEEVSQEAAVQKNRSIIISNKIPKDRAKFFATMSRKGYEVAVNKYVKESMVHRANNFIKRIWNKGA